MSKMSEISKEFELPLLQKEAILKEMKNLLSKYGHNYEVSALSKIIDTWAARKGWIINLLSKNENWNPNKFQIQFSYDYTRGIDNATIKEFFRWAEGNIWCNIKNIEIAGFNGESIQQAIQRMDKIIQSIYDIRGVSSDANVTVNGFSKDYLVKERERLFRISKRLSEKTKLITYRYSEKYADIESAKKFEDFLNFGKVIINYFGSAEGEGIHLCPQNLVIAINNIYPDIAKTGQKITKIIQKVCKLYGLDKIKEMETIVRNGQEEDKDYGWNYQIAQLGDAINPLKFSRHTIISVNPIDYLTMSFGYKWSSCHTIDTCGYRDNHSFSGEYSAGTISYMLDNSSMIFYTVDPAYDGTEFELQDKMQRCVFAIGQDKLYEGRVYPDGRDGGDQSLAAQFRAVMQKVIADALGVTNMWNNKKGTDECCKVLNNDNGCAYNDWRYYNDCNMSYLKDGNEINEIAFYINSAPISIVYGEYHSVENSIEGDDEDYVTCERCGNRIYRDDAIYVEEADCYFCDSECASEAGYEYCSDICDYTSDFYYDEYTYEYFANTDEMVVIEDGYRNTYYSCAYHAENDGYTYCENTDRWIKDDEVYIDSYSGESFEWVGGESIEIDGNYYLDAHNAEADGYIMNSDGEWVPSEEESA